MVGPVIRYYHMLAALSINSFCLVRHLLLEETDPESYAQLRASPLASHSLSIYQNMERMMWLPPLSDHKHSVMLEFCPVGESSTCHICLSLPAVPSSGNSCPAVRGCLRTIAKKADRLIAIYVPQSHDTCVGAAAEEQLDGDKCHGSHAGGSQPQGQGTGGKQKRTRMHTVTVKVLNRSKNGKPKCIVPAIWKQCKQETFVTWVINPDQETATRRTTRL